MTQWQDLPEEDKVKVISGMVMVARWLILFFIFFEVFRRGYLPFGASPFSGMRMALLTMYIVLVIPSALVTAVAVVYLRRHFSEVPSTVVVVRDVLLGILLGGGGYLLFVGFFLTLFDIFLSGLPFQAAIILIALALFVPAIIIAKTMIAKKNSKYLKWAFK